MLSSWLFCLFVFITEGDQCIGTRFQMFTIPPAVTVGNDAWLRFISDGYVALTDCAEPSLGASREWTLTLVSFREGGCVPRLGPG